MAVRKVISFASDLQKAAYTAGLAASQALISNWDWFTQGSL